MSEKIATAMRGVKAVDAEIVQWENRVQFVQDEVKRLTQTKDNLEADIARKQSDYQVYVSAKDADSKKLRQDALDERAQMDKDKAEFQAILSAFKAEKDSFADTKKSVDDGKANVEERMNAIRQFVIAVQRACTLLGL